MQAYTIPTPVQREFLSRSIQSTSSFEMPTQASLDVLHLYFRRLAKGEKIEVANDAEIPVRTVFRAK